MPGDDPRREPPEAAGLLVGLDAEQRACVVHPPGTLAIQAGAGSGKTRVLTHRVAYRVLTGTADAEHTLVLTFTRKAAGELRSRLHRLGVDGAHVGTIHAFARNLLERYWADAGRPPRPLVGHPKRLVGEVVTELGTRASPETVLAEVEWAAARAVGPDEYATAVRQAGRRTPAPPDQIATIYGAYRDLKRRRGVMDIQDLLPELVDALADPGFAAATRWRFRHVSVDEAQDLNRAQWQVIRGVVGDRDDLCMVGDVHQAVYGWNGADPRYLSELRRAFPDAAELRLVRNYRSAPAVVTVSDRVLRPDQPTVVGGERDEGQVAIHSYPTDRAEAQAVAWGVRRALSEGVGLSQIAVLGRTHEVLRPLSRELRRAGIPVRTGRGLLDEPIVRRALAGLDSVPATLAAPHCVTELRLVVDELLETEVARRLGAEAAPELEMEPEVEAALRAELAPQAERLGQLVELAAEWAEQVPTGTRRYLGDWLAANVRSRGGEVERTGPAVELATFHRAKGLQWRRVFVVGLEAGLVPLAPPGTGVVADGAEERRLLYVALTRAEERLECSLAARRHWRGRPIARSPSPFVAEITDGVAAVESDERNGGPETPPDVAREHVRQIRQLLADRHRRVG